MIDFEKYLIANEATQFTIDQQEEILSWANKVGIKCNKWVCDYTANGEYTGSRLGGVPYIDKSAKQFKTLTKDKGNEFIAQINLKDLKVRGELPSSGILQFWCNGSNVGVKEKNTVLYYPTIDRSMTYDIFKSMQTEYYNTHVTMLNNQDYSFLIGGEKALHYGSKMVMEEYLSIPWGAELMSLVKRGLIEDAPDFLKSDYFRAFKDFPEIDPYTPENLNITGGYGSSVQEVPRDEVGDYLLLQLKTKWNYKDDSKISVVIGDSGIIRWRIPIQSLKQKKFSEAFNRWECH